MMTKTFVAVVNERVIGFISSVWSYEIGRKVGFMHIVGLAVKKQNQNQGVGKLLLKTMENYAKEKGITSIILNSGVQRIGAHAFYEHNGYNKIPGAFQLSVPFGT